jgi:hypothetical protein
VKIPCPASYVHNSQHFIQILNQLKITEGDILIGFNVESLFTKVLLYNMLEIILEHITAVNLPQDLSSLMDHCVSSTFFIHQGKFYRQVQGAAMGSPLSPLLANIFMTAFKVEAIDSSLMKPKCWHRYLQFGHTDQPPLRTFLATCTPGTPTSHFLWN